MLTFQKNLVGEILQDTDCLAVLAKGLGLINVVVQLVSLYSVNDGQTYGTKAGGSFKVFLLNLSDENATRILRLCTYKGMSRGNKTLPHIINSTNKGSSNKNARKSLYDEGGCFIITPRILVVDLLTEVIDPHEINGLVIMDVHNLLKLHNIKFILHIFNEARFDSNLKGKDREQFVKTFTESPTLLGKGLSQLSQIVSTIGMPKILIWPRFHSNVKESLATDVEDKNSFQVYELKQPLTKSMKIIQAAIVESIDACIKELKKNAKVDVSNLTIENSLFKSFDLILKQQLNPVWHQVGRKTKNLVADLSKLRKLLSDLLRYDSVTFYSRILGLKRTISGSMNEAPSPWLFTDAADRLFKAAKERVYTFVDKNPPQISEKNESRMKIKIKLEQNPKIILLFKILKEIEAELKKTKELDDTFFVLGGADILILCNDLSVANDLKIELVNYKKNKTNEKKEKSELLLRRFYKFIEQQQDVTFRAMSAELEKKERARTLNAGVESSMNYHRRIKNLEKEYGKKLIKKIDKNSDEYKARLSRMTYEQRFLLKEYEKLDDYFNIQYQLEEIEQEEEEEEENKQSFRILSRSNIIIGARDSFKSFTGYLNDIKPRFIIIYDPDVTLAREIEIFHAENPNWPLRVYVLIFESSVEEQKNLSDVKKEQDAFTSLIQDKSHLVVPQRSKMSIKTKNDSIKDTNFVVYNASTGKTITKPISSSSSSSSNQQQFVIVDMREFRSALPFMLYLKDIHVEPVTLGVGDYILAPDICVERKSISDLFQSFNSGRLYKQAESMSRHYKYPALLIEFNPDRPFSLQSETEFASDINSKNIISKLVLLTLHFPQLWLIWSPSPHATVDLFLKLKLNRQEPKKSIAKLQGVDEDYMALFDEDGDQQYLLFEEEEETAVEQPNNKKLKVSSSSSSSSTAVASKTTANSNEKPNHAAIDMLRKFPGVNPHNIHYILSNVESLSELAEITISQLTLFMGKVNAEQLYEFLHKDAIV